MTYYITNETDGETTTFTNKRKAEKFKRDLNKEGKHANIYIYDGDRRIT